MFEVLDLIKLIKKKVFLCIILYNAFIYVILYFNYRRQCIENNQTIKYNLYNQKDIFVLKIGLWR